MLQPSVSFYDVDEEASGQRLDNLLARLLKGVPKSHVYRLIRSGQVRINGARCAADDRLAAGDRVRVPPVRQQAARPARVPPVEFPILYEDDHLLVIDKPAGVAVHGGSGVSSGVIEQLRAARPQARTLELVHRLDRETSGVLMIAKKRSALVDLQRRFRERQVDKRYRAIVVGRWPLRTRTLDDPLQRYLTGEGERRVAVQADGAPALTRVTGLAHVDVPQAGLCTLVECRIETGRTHQIRVHLAHAGFPIVGDEKYGDFELNKSLAKQYNKRMFLHAFYLKLMHGGVAGGPVLFEAPTPPEFAAFMGAATGAATGATMGATPAIAARPPRAALGKSGRAA
ncbi:MAG TPA: RluA family pseudouridine synthase [Burkholderiaceae bacterium]|nr:RluA family pseudouridine synthase [Burkholderiaceae bacterium]